MTRQSRHIDFLVDLERERGLQDVIGLENDFSDLFGRKVQHAVRRKLASRGVRESDVAAAVNPARRRMRRHGTP